MELQDFNLIENGRNLLPRPDVQWIAVAHSSVHIGSGNDTGIPIQIIVTVPIRDRPIGQVIAIAIAQLWERMANDATFDRIH